MRTKSGLNVAEEKDRSGRDEASSHSRIVLSCVCESEGDV